MTDKVQKILSEIATRKLCTMDEHMAFYNDKAKEDYRFLSEIEELINTLQKEPVCKDFEVALEKKVREAQDWTYIEEEGGECPLNEEFGADDLEEFARWGANWQKQQDSISAKNLEELISTLSKRYPEVSFAKLSRIVVRVAKWQKQQILDSNTTLQRTFELGKQEMKQQMMTKAVEVEISDNGCAKGLQFIPVWPFTDEYVGGDKVKVIIVKE